MGSGTVVPPHSLLILLYSIVLTVKRRVWSYGVWYCCAPSLPLDTAVFYVVDGRVDRSCFAPPSLLIPLEYFVLMA